MWIKFALQKVCHLSRKDLTYKWYLYGVQCWKGVGSISQSWAACIVNSYKVTDKKICGWLFINNLLLYGHQKRQFKKKKKGVCFSSIQSYLSSVVAGHCSAVTGSSPLSCWLWRKSLLADSEHPSSGGEPALCSSQVKGSGWSENQSLAYPCLTITGLPPCHPGEWHRTSGKAISSACTAPLSPSSPCSGSDQDLKTKICSYQ